ncbi:MAG: response regulator transcription factor [Dethiobacteria bacterium]
MIKILIIEDNKKIRDELSIFLTKNGYFCEAPDEFEDIIDVALSGKPHLVLLDINLPVYDGYYICRELRKRSDVPIIVVTSRDSEIDELTAMNLGADDFVTKPYNTQILIARISSVLKRAYKESISDRLDCGSFVINLSKSSLEYSGSEVGLTKNELKIMTCLFEHKGAIVSRDELMTRLWDSDMFVDDNTLTVNINRLRKKLEACGLENVIETKRGQGYLLR